MLVQALKDGEEYYLKVDGKYVRQYAAPTEYIRHSYYVGRSIRRSAVATLGEIGPEAKKAAVPALALKDGDWHVRQSAAEALEKVNIEAESTEDTKFDF